MSSGSLGRRALAALVIVVATACAACSVGGDDGGGAERSAPTVADGPSTDVEDGCPTAEAMAEIVGKPMELRRSLPEERSCDYRSTAEDTSPATLLVDARPWQTDGGPGGWDRARYEQERHDVEDAPDLGPEGFTAEVPSICAAMMPGLRVEVTYGPSGCDAAIAIAVAVADAWGLPH